ncbi:uncharacterized protein LOC126903619 isoform X2 [Daktulosphaira vitifoliae]|nr:uncharacterized protein LOC126903619 isoform X2 [Daktulosphaira vitifoliae]
MMDYQEQNENESWVQNMNDTSLISVNVKKSLKQGRSNKKYNFRHDPTDTIDHNVQEYNGIDYIKMMQKYLEERNLGEAEFTVFQCKSKANLPAYYANINLGVTSLASSFPEKYSLPEVAKQVAARNALGLLKKKYDDNNIPTTKNMSLVVERLELELKKNYAGLFCDKVVEVYRDVYNECLPENWLNSLRNMKTDIIIEELPKQNKAILYYSLHNNLDQSMDTTVNECNAPLMKFVDKTERQVVVTTIDSSQKIWIRFIHDKINILYNEMFNTMNKPGESKSFIKMYSIEVDDVYAVEYDEQWHRYQVTKIENNNILGILIDLGLEFSIPRDNVMYLPPKFLKFPSQAISCALTSLFFAPYFPVCTKLFETKLFGNEFTAKPDNIESEIPTITLYNGKINVNSMLMNDIIQLNVINELDSPCKANLSFVADGYMYLHPFNETLLVLESVLDTISESRPLEKFYSKRNISPSKVYLVKCIELNTWSRAIISDFIFSDHQFNVYFIDYGNCSLIDQDKFIPLELLDPMLAVIPPQALKVGFHLFPPEEFTESRSRALYEMAIDKLLDVVLITKDNAGVPVVEIFDAAEDPNTRLSFNTQLYQSV